MTPRVRLLHGAAEIRDALPAWRACAERFPDRLLPAEPDYALLRHADAIDDLFLALAGPDEAPVAAAPLLLSRTPLSCRMGEVVWARLPVRRLRLLATAALLPGDGALLEAILGAALDGAPEFDAFTVSRVPRDSFLHRGLAESRILAERLAPGADPGASTQMLIAIAGSYREYLRSRPRRIRVHDRMRKLSRFGEVRLERFTEPTRVPEFVVAAAAVSRRTYQYHLLGLGLRDPAKAAREFAAQAERGWFRSYLLFVGERPCSFMVGVQGPRRYHAISTGFDPAFRDGAPGIVLLLRLIEDLFDFRPPEHLDFGQYGDYKARFATETVEEEGVMLLSRRAWPRIAFGLERASDRVSSFVVKTLDRIGLKERVKRAIRSGAGPRPEAEAERAPSEPEPEAAEPAPGGQVAETWIEERIRARSEARERRDFAAADRIRDECAAAGVLLRDTKEGTVWSRAEEVEAAAS